MLQRVGSAKDRTRESHRVLLTAPNCLAGALMSTSFAGQMYMAQHVSIGSRSIAPYIEDGDLPINSNHIVNRIRPVALGRGNWFFASSLRAGQRAGR